MPALLIAALLLLQATAPSPTPQPPAPEKPAPTAPDPNLEQQLLSVKRIYVDSFGDDPIAKQIEANIVSQLTENKRFIVTENKERADAFLRGSGVEKDSQEFHAHSEGTAAGQTAISDSGASTETIHDARVAVRLVNRDGDVLWATTQESKGAKYKGASADVADKVVKELLRTLEKLEKEKKTAPAPTAAPSPAKP